MHRTELAKFADAEFTPDTAERLTECLRDHGVLKFQRFDTGLFPASPAGESVAFSGYENVWVRDNVWVAYAHLITGDTATAVGVANALAAFFLRHLHRFDAIIEGRSRSEVVMNRPHVRFNGKTLAEVPGTRWAHAQNDALGYFVWLFAQLVARGELALDEPAKSMMARFVRYFMAIEFWQDEDSGHWEEQRKISASSIGTVVGGLAQLQAVDSSERDLLSELISKGRAALGRILPHECRQAEGSKRRRYDAALLFLVHPLGVVEGSMADQILSDITTHLQGQMGIRRYPGDSYWAPDYEMHVAAADRTRDFSNDVQSRNALLTRDGDEAQWCLFDPILAAYYAKCSDEARQRHHFSRTLAQITGNWQCPEFYYWQRGRMVPGPHTPLQWTQANLLLALHSLNLAEK